MKSIIFVITILFLTYGYISREYEYNKLMSKIKSTKLKEEVENIPAKVFDGVIEPKFPISDSEENSITGVDANNDGIRDDIEIWINRTAESDEIRKSFKDYYRKTILMYKVVEDKGSAIEYKTRLDEVQISGICLLQAAFPFNEKYLEDHDIDAGIVYSRYLEILFPNSAYRKSILAKEEKYPILGVLHTEDDDVVANCEKVIGQKEYKALLKLAKEYAKTQRRKNK